MGHAGALLACAQRSTLVSYPTASHSQPRCTHTTAAQVGRPPPHRATLRQHARQDRGRPRRQPPDVRRARVELLQAAARRARHEHGHVGAPRHRAAARDARGVGHPHRAAGCQGAGLWGRRVRRYGCCCNHPGGGAESLGRECCGKMTSVIEPPDRRGGIFNNGFSLGSAQKKALKSLCTQAAPAPTYLKRRPICRKPAYAFV